MPLLLLAHRAPVLRPALTAAVAPLLALMACGGDGTAPIPLDTSLQGQPEGGLGAADGDAGTTPMGDCPPENPYCTAGGGGGSVCGSAAVELEQVGVNIMVAVDGAASMATHWNIVQQAVRDLRGAHPDAAIGLQLFWGELATWESGWEKSNWCGATESRVLDVGLSTADALIDFLGDTPPGPSFVGGLWETSPVIEPLNHILTDDAGLADPTRSNYLLLITNGNDNCFGSVFAQQNDKLLAYEKLAIELGKRDIRVIPIGFDAAAVEGATGVFETVEEGTDEEVLQTLLDHGGSGLSEVPKVDDPARLAEVLARVGEQVQSCRFAIPAALGEAAEVNPFALDFLVNGNPVVRDRLGQNGWNFVPGTQNEIELFGQACQALQSGATFEAYNSCASDVCGTASIEVETKARAVLFVFDVSASRIECTDGTTSCQVAPQLADRASVSYWEAAGHALNQSLVAPVNDDIEFGIQFFPAKRSSALSCDVDATPEVPPADGTEITIMSQMLEKLPFGSSPLLQVMENVAASPGRLAEEDVEGAVVVLSAGGDDCAGVEQDELVTRLGDAAAQLLAAGVETHVVRFGLESSKTPETEAQLRALVENGGTARVDPMDADLPPYVDAQDAAELNAALAEISDTLASCDFELGGLPPLADRSNVNLYLNGEVVPYDEQHLGEQGWDWLDEEQTAVQLAGDACEAFKTNRRTSVVVELGCQPIVVL